jgi:hypothetical protein
MDDENAHPEYSREPTIEDLVVLCRQLNQAGVNYVVIGGFAIILNGYTRTTGDIDLLVDSAIENVDLIKQALLYLPDKAITEVNADDVAKYSVVRVADEILIDLMHKACDVTYAKAKDYIEYREIEGTKIPFLKPELLIQTKQTLRAKDAPDRMFLEYLLALQNDASVAVKPKTAQAKKGGFLRFLRSLFRQSD